MADEEDDKTYIFSDTQEERTREFQPSDEIQALRERLAAVVEGPSSRKPGRHLPDGPTMPHIKLPAEDEPTDETPRHDEVTNVTSTPKPTRPPRRDDATSLNEGSSASQRVGVVPGSEEPTHIGEAPRAPARSGQHPSPPRPGPAPPRPEPPKPAPPPSKAAQELRSRPHQQSGRHPSPSLEVRGARTAAPGSRRPSSADVTVITEAEPEGSYNKRLVPREPRKQQVSADVLAEADGLVSLGSPDATVIGYASSLSGFHDIEVLGRNVSLKRPRRLVVGISMLLGLAVTGALATTLLQAWTTPDRLWVLAASGMTLSGVLSALVGASVWKRAGRGAVVGAAAGLICSLGCAAIAFGWSQEDVRARILASWSGYSQTFRDALDDRSPTVRATACRQILARGDVDGRQQLLPMLTVSPEAASQCLADVDSEMGLELAQLVAQRWSRELLADMESEQGPERIAAITAALPGLPLDRAEIDLRLLNCTFNAPKEIAQKQCAETLGATFAGDDQWGSRLGGVADTGVADGVTSRGIVAMAFGSRSLKQMHKKLAKSADATAKGNQWQAVTVANEVLSRESSEAVPELVAALEGKCDLDVTKLPQSRDTWFNITSAALQRRETVDPVAGLCAATREAFASDAFENARALVAASIRQSGRQDARDIDSGWLMINAHKSQTQSDLRSMLPKDIDEAEAQKVMRIYSQPAEGENAGHPVFLGP